MWKYVYEGGKWVLKRMGVSVGGAKSADEITKLVQMAERFRKAENVSEKVLKVEQVAEKVIKVEQVAEKVIKVEQVAEKAAKPGSAIIRNLFSVPKNILTPAQALGARNEFIRAVTLGIVKRTAPKVIEKAPTTVSRAQSTVVRLLTPVFRPLEKLAKPIVEPIKIGRELYGYYRQLAKLGFSPGSLALRQMAAAEANLLYSGLKLLGVGRHIASLEKATKLEAAAWAAYRTYLGYRIAGGDAPDIRSAWRQLSREIESRLPGPVPLPADPAPELPPPPTVESLPRPVESPPPPRPVLPITPPTTRRESSPLPLRTIPRVRESTPPKVRRL